MLVFKQLFTIFKARCSIAKNSSVLNLINFKSTFLRLYILIFHKNKTRQFVWYSIQRHHFRPVHKNVFTITTQIQSNKLVCFYKQLPLSYISVKALSYLNRGRIYSHVPPSYERAVGDLDRSVNISLWV